MNKQAADIRKSRFAAGYRLHCNVSGHYTAESVLADMNMYSPYLPYQPLLASAELAACSSSETGTAC